MTLTVSADVQRTALAALDGRKGTVGVYNYKTGEILCAVSSPTYDPDDVPGRGGNPETYEGVYVNRFPCMPPIRPDPSSSSLRLRPRWMRSRISDPGRSPCEGSAVIGGETIQCKTACTAR